MMKRIIALFLVVGTVSAQAPRDPSREGPAIVAEAFGRLSGALAEAMANGGPVGALPVCSEKAPIWSLTTTRRYLKLLREYAKSSSRNKAVKFVEVAASVSGVPAARIRQWAPADGTDTPPKLRVLPALERERGAPLSEEQRGTINHAEKEKIEAIERAKKEALRR